MRRSGADRASRCWSYPIIGASLEFLGLTAAEAERRMREGRDVVEQATGRAVTGSVAPAWLYGPGARSAMREVGFALA